MTRSSGRCPVGERLVAAVPHGHWKVLTTIAAMAGDGILAGPEPDRERVLEDQGAAQAPRGPHGGGAGRRGARRCRARHADRRPRLLPTLRVRRYSVMRNALE